MSTEEDRETILKLEEAMAGIESAASIFREAGEERGTLLVAGILSCLVGCIRGGYAAGLEAIWATADRVTDELGEHLAAKEERS